MACISEDMDISVLIEMANSSEILDEGIISAIKGKLTSMAISMCNEKTLNTIINKAFTKAMGQAKTPEAKQKLMDLRKEMLALDKKASEFMSAQ